MNGDSEARNTLSGKSTDVSRPPAVLVIFGITGNLAAIKLLPAVHQLIRHGLLGPRVSIIGVARKHDFTAQQATETMVAGTEARYGSADPHAIERFGSQFKPLIMDPSDPSQYEKLAAALEACDRQAGQPCQRIYYLAIPPNVFRAVLDAIDSSGLGSGKNGLPERILVEKPLGTDYESASELIAFMGQRFDESQIYRIDHYLAKETAQNILTFRFQNPIIGSVWNNSCIEHIQITAAETIGIEGRTNFYEGVGALRDFVQSHLLQLMVLTMMEAPASFSAADIHAEKQAILDAIRPVEPRQADAIAVRGQYAGYSQETGNDGSTVETFMALKLAVHTPRWEGVPVLLRTGKALALKSTEIHVVFRGKTAAGAPANILTIRIQPNEGIGLSMIAKEPGFASAIRPVTMQFDYTTSFAGNNPDAYERVIADAIAGDQSLFASSHEVLQSWRLLDPILHHWHRSHGATAMQPWPYPRGSWGPAEADALPRSFGAEWLNSL